MTDPSRFETLWLAFPEDSLSARRFDAAAQARLGRIFDAADPAAPWPRALGYLKMTPQPAGVEMLGWREGVPYINGSALCAIVTDGTAVAVRGADGGYRFATPHKILHLPRVMALQWRVTRFVQDRLRNLAAPDPDPIVESLTLGVAVQVLLMRLGGKLYQHMPAYLVQPERAPAVHRQTFRWLQALQLRRSALSPVWHRLFADTRIDPLAPPPVPFFWGDDDRGPSISAPPEAVMPLAAGTVFRGQAVSGAGAQADAAVMTPPYPDLPLPRADRPIFVFRHARPETVAYFPQAAGIVFAHGGVLSHACVVAREMGLPCVTGLGDAFYTQIAACTDAPVRLSIDGSNGEVRIISC